MRPAASTSALGQVGERAAELGLVREGRTQHIFLSDPAQQEMTGWWHAEAHGNVWESPPYTSLPNCVFSAVTFGAEISCGSGIYTTGISKHWSGFTFCPKPQPAPATIPCNELVSQHTIALGFFGGPLSSTTHGRYHFLIKSCTLFCPLCSPPLLNKAPLSPPNLLKNSVLSQTSSAPRKRGACYNRQGGG